MTKAIVELPPGEALVLAQLVKRLGYDDAQRPSSRPRTCLMLTGIDKLWRALAETGFAPR